MLERATHHTKWLIHKYRGSIISPETYLGTEIIEGNILLNEGITELLTNGGLVFTHIGVGDGTTTADATQTGLQGANKCFKAMSGTYPKVIDQTLYCRAIFGAADAVYAWNEFTVVKGSDDIGINLNRKVQAKGTKADDTWILECQIRLE